MEAVKNYWRMIKVKLMKKVVLAGASLLMLGIFSGCSSSNEKKEMLKVTKKLNFGQFHYSQPLTITLMRLLIILKKRIRDIKLFGKIIHTIH